VTAPKNPINNISSKYTLKVHSTQEKLDYLSTLNITNLQYKLKVPSTQ